MKSNAPMFGEYVKLLKTGEIHKWVSYDPQSHLVEIVMPAGGISTFKRNEIDRITTGEELEFLRSCRNPK